MKIVTPVVRLLSRPQIDWQSVADYLRDDVGASTDWVSGRADAPHGEALIEFYARLCYRSFEPGLNANVTRVRQDRAEYFENILRSRHGSVLAHAHYGFVFHDVSRVFTHEIVRHAAGTDISQESLRYVRLDDIRFWMPEWAAADDELQERATHLIELAEVFQCWMAKHFKLDDPSVPFNVKKTKTSFMRRFAPEGLATTIGMTFNVRALRHVLETRWSEHAEEEMLVVMPQLYAIMQRECPLLFNDYTIERSGIATPYRKV